MENDLTNLITVLNLDPVEADHASLQNIVGQTEWQLTSSATLEAALDLLGRQRIPILFCESDLRPGLWQDLLAKLLALPDPPFLIVTSRLADDRLWAEALNLGAYDVLSKPFEHAEVTRIIGAASLRWAHRPKSAPGVRSCAA